MMNAPATRMGDYKVAVERSGAYHRMDQAGCGKMTGEPHPQPEYVITEDELLMMAKIGEYSNNFFKFVPPMVSRIRSRSAQSDTGKVLNELEKEMSERIEHLKKMNKTETQLAYWGECQSWWVRIQELRQQGEG